MLCKNCGVEIEDNETLCEECEVYADCEEFDYLDYDDYEYHEEEQRYETKPKKRIIALSLCLLLGLLGIHRLYLGYTGSGILIFLLVGPLAVTTGGITFWFGVAWVIYDFLLIVLGRLKASDGRDLV